MSPQVSHLRLAPDERSLDFRDDDLSLRDPRKEDGDRVPVDGEIVKCRVKVF